jgi:hypothetical protein
MLFETLDLHGYTVADAMTRFVGKYNWMLREGQGGETRALRVIHGKGKAGAEGAIREALRGFLKSQGKRIKGYDAQLAVRGAEYLLDDCGRLAYMHGEDVDRNGGQTIVVPRERIRVPPDLQRYRF